MGIMVSPSLIQGRIVFPHRPIPDPQGRNPKLGRPFVVITSTEDIPSRDLIQIVGITDELTESPAEHYVELRWGPRKDDLDIGLGYVVPSDVLLIVQKV